MLARRADRWGGEGEDGSRWLHFAACGGFVTAEIGEPALLDSARRLFLPYEIPPSGANELCRAAVRLRVVPGGYVVESVDIESTACMTAFEALAALELQLTGSLLAGCRRYAHLHAAGAVVDGAAVLALGGAGAGKSSLALCWAAAGHAVLGDDVVLLTGARQALPFKRLFKVSPEMLHTVGIDVTKTPFWDPDSSEAWYDPRDGSGWAQGEGGEEKTGSPVAVIAVAQYVRDAPLLLEEISNAEVLNCLIHSLMPTGASVDLCFENLLLTAVNARSYRVRFGFAPEAARALSACVK